MPDTTSTTTPNARATFAAAPPAASQDTGASRIGLRRAVLAVPGRTPR